MAYYERLVALGVVVWSNPGAAGEQRILPDGCLDLIFDGDRLVVAGPDTSARIHVSGSVAPGSVAPGSVGPVIGVRLHGGRGPALLGVPADALTDSTLALEQLWGDRRARILAGRVARDPARELAVWATSPDEGSGALPGGPADGFGPLLLALLARGAGIAEAAGVLGYSPRQLHRRSLPVFGYGPQHLGRVLRLQRALAVADRGVGWATVAAQTGYADQAHLARDVRALTGVTPTALRRERDVRSVQDAA